MFGLFPRDRTIIQNARFEEIDRALIFGSRAMGNHKKGSDVDIAVSGESVTSQTIDTGIEIYSRET